MPYNHFAVSGRLTRNPEQANDTKAEVVRASLAVNEKRNGQDTVMFVNITAFGKTGLSMLKYCHKGDVLIVDGRLEVRAYLANDGTAKPSVDLILNSWCFAGGNAPAEPASTPRAYEPEGLDENVPF
jgi:single-stranded DNA-binding protein